MAIQVPVYSEQPLTPAALQVINAIIASEFPAWTFKFIEYGNMASGQPIPKILVFGKAPEGHSAEWLTRNGTQWIFTYSIAQIMSKPNAASVLVASLQQFYGHPIGAAINMVNGPKAVFPESVGNLLDLTKPVAVDIETAGNLDIETPEQVKLLSMAFYQPGEAALVVTKAHIYDSSGTIDPRFIALIESIKYPIWHNGKFDIRVIEAQTGVRMTNYFDTMLAHHVLNQGAGDHKLKTLARRYLGAPEWEKDLSKYTKGGAYYENIPLGLLIEYNGWDVYWTYQLYEFLSPQLMADEVVQAAYMLEMAASDFFIEVEQRGFAVDINYASILETDMILEETKLLLELRQLVGDQSFNPGSWQQVSITIANWGLSVSSTDEAHLTELKDQITSSNQATHIYKHVVTFIETLLEYRGVKKALTTYVQAALRRSVDGRVHTTFLIHGTVTGRLSSSGPNIQNIPRDKKFRKLYIG